MMWFTADLHFGHSSILSKMNRPFETIERMNQGLIAAINERVAPSDSLYVLGDFAYQTTAENARRLREQISCEHVHLIRGRRARARGFSKPSRTISKSLPATRAAISSFCSTTPS